METPRPRIPRLVDGVDLRALPLSPTEGFVLSRIDGSATVQDLSDLTSLDVQSVESTIRKLIDHGAVEWADGTMGLPRTSFRPPTPSEPIPRTAIPQAPRVPLIKPSVTESEPPKSTREPSRPNIPRPYFERIATAEKMGAARRDETSHAIAGTARIGLRGPERGPTDSSSEHGPIRTPKASPSPTPKVAAEPLPKAAAEPLPKAAAEPLPKAAAEPLPKAAAEPLPKAAAEPLPKAAAEPPPKPPGDAPAIDLAPERRARIDDLYPKLDVLDHYEVLGLPRDADVTVIRSTYFELSKVFHPDTAFRKNLGVYKSRMEAIFKRLTEAYEVLGKKKARAEYDAYLGLQTTTRAVEAVIAPAGPNESASESVPAKTAAPTSAPANTATPISVPVKATTPTSVPAKAATPTSVPANAATLTSVPAKAPTPPSAASASNVPSAPAPHSSPPPQEPRATMSEEGKRRARELLEKRLTAGRAQAAPATPPPPATGSSAPRPRQEVLRDLTSSLRGAAVQTGGLDPVHRHAMEARRAEQAGDLATAARELRLAVALAPDRDDVAAEQARVAKLLATQLADSYRQQAEYEERHKKWAAAALSWAKVVEGRPDDPVAHQRAAAAFVEAKGDLHKAQRFAQRACELAPNDALSRRTLGRVFAAAGLGLNARRELEKAASLDPSDSITKNLLRDLRG